MMNKLENAQKNIEKKGFLDLETPDGIDFVAGINQLREEKNAVILAHYYQENPIQDIADFVGDSLALAQKAAQTKADMIVFAGVHFMAETAKILNPHKKVLLPDLKAGCSLADSCPPEAFEKFVKAHPDHKVVTYINCSAVIKTLSDVVCTSSNAVKIIESFPKDQPLIFAPDRNLGDYLNKQTGRNMILWDGACTVHEAFSMEKMLDLHCENPTAEIIAHPESPSYILKLASYIGSTAGLLKYAKESKSNTFIVATEAGILHEMSKTLPHKNLIPAPSKDNNTCACSECAYMRLNTMKKLYTCMKYELPEIIVEKEMAAKAIAPIEKMLALSK